MYVISLILLWLPNIFFLLAMRVIRFKSHKRCDEFVLLWNTGYRLANIFFTFFSITLFQALQCFRNNPDEFLQTLAFGIIRQSSFLMNLIILATGQETMLQLLQWRSLIKQALYRPLINLNARSRRFIDWLNEPPEFERAFIFGKILYVMMSFDSFDCTRILALTYTRYSCRFLCSRVIVRIDDCNSV